MPSVLTTLAHGSAAFISTFLLIHLSAPAMASIGGTSLASQVMILGREYYKTSFGHTYLVAIPILVHSLCGLAKRIVGERRSRKFRSAFALTGYASTTFLLPIHYLLHRVFPANPNPPILAVGPAELDYEYVKLGLQRWPVTNTLLYAGLTLCVAWHAAEGLQIVWNTWVASKAGIWKDSARRRAVGVLAVVLPVFTGMLTIAREPLMVFSSTAERYEAAFRHFASFRVS